jgi:hypothetical protein
MNPLLLKLFTTALIIALVAGSLLSAGEAAHPRWVNYLRTLRTIFGVGCAFCIGLLLYCIWLRF